MLDTLKEPIGLELHKMVNEAYAIDKKNGNTLWQDAIQRDEKCKDCIPNYTQGQEAPNGFQYANCHMVFDIKMEDFWWKAHLVAGGHMTHTLDTITYSRVVTGETVHIAHNMVALHNLEVKAADVLNLCDSTQSWKDMDSIMSNFWGWCW